ncbi:MAG: M1 family metallopeptidase [Holophaga sp.]|jgi:leukotriene A-4 hydrolase/aminopeptidase
MARTDPHSYFDDAQPRATRWVLRLLADFDSRTLGGEITLVFPRPAEGDLDLDTKGLAIHRAWVVATDLDVPFELGPEQPILGRRLRLHLPADTRAVAIAYETSPQAAGLQWLEPAQTEGGQHPFLFSQCQAIHARTLAPCQDSAAARITYDAEVVVPEGLRAVMSAGPLGDEPGDVPGTRLFRFRMPQPIPSYLLALAVGDLDSRELSPRSRVWAEPAAVERAAWEFAEVEDLIRTAEGLFGPYEWDRFDLLVLPPAFPYGGMENPRMTFLTPTLLAGDRSLVDVVAHELAHSWTGNLVTNATAEHFWLNEGFTVWAERRILKALRGDDAWTLAWAIGQKALEGDLERFRHSPELTLLRTRLQGVDPDDAFSSVPYEKGARLVAALEQAAGEDVFAAFLRAYMKRFRFTSITTEQFCAFVEEQMPGVLRRVDADAWLHQPGMPPGTPAFRSAKLEEITALARCWAQGARPADVQVQAWNPDELLVFLQNLPRTLTPEGCAWLDRKLALTGRGNYEVLVEWLTLAAASGYRPAFGRIREVLLKVGRMKYLRPLYAALAANPDTRELAREIFAQAEPGYHNLSRRVVRGVLDKYAD